MKVISRSLSRRQWIGSAFVLAAACVGACLLLRVGSGEPLPSRVFPETTTAPSEDVHVVTGSPDGPPRRVAGLGNAGTVRVVDGEQRALEGVQLYPSQADRRWVPFEVPILGETNANGQVWLSDAALRALPGDTRIVAHKPGYDRVVMEPDRITAGLVVSLRQSPLMQFECVTLPDSPCEGVVVACAIEGPDDLPSGASRPGAANDPVYAGVSTATGRTAIGLPADSVWLRARLAGHVVVDGETTDLRFSPASHRIVLARLFGVLARVTGDEVVDFRMTTPSSLQPGGPGTPAALGLVRELRERWPASICFAGPALPDARAGEIVEIDAQLRDRGPVTVGLRLRPIASDTQPEVIDAASLVPTNVGRVHIDCSRLCETTRLTELRLFLVRGSDPRRAWFESTRGSGKNEVTVVPASGELRVVPGDYVVTSMMPNICVALDPDGARVEVVAGGEAVVTPIFAYVMREVSFSVTSATDAPILRLRLHVVPQDRRRRGISMDAPADRRSVHWLGTGNYSVTLAATDFEDLSFELVVEEGPEPLFVDRELNPLAQPAGKR